MKIKIKSHLAIILSIGILSFLYFVFKYVNAADTENINIVFYMVFSFFASFFVIAGMTNGVYLTYAYANRDSRLKRILLILQTVALFPFFLITGMFLVFPMLYFDISMLMKHYVAYKLSYDSPRSPYLVQGIFDPLQDQVADINCREQLKKLRRKMTVIKDIIIVLVVVISFNLVSSSIELNDGILYPAILLLIIVLLFLKLYHIYTRKVIKSLYEQYQEEPWKCVEMLDYLVDEHIVSSKIGEYYLYYALEKEENISLMKKLRGHNNHYLAKDFRKNLKKGIH